MIKRILFVAAVIICLFIINNLAHSIFDLSQKQHLLTQTGQELTKKQAENATLKRKLAAAQGNTFVEQQARDKLFLVKPGEEQVILPGNLDKTKQMETTMQVAPNWQQWIHLFFH